MRANVKKRRFGLLMPVSSLPSDEGIGTLGRGSYEFIDFMAASGASVWQVLPLVPTGYGDSPYQSCCSSANNYYFIDLATLVGEGLLTAEEVNAACLGYDKRRIDYGLQYREKVALLRKAFARFPVKERAFQAFLKRGEYRDFALFMSLKGKFEQRAFSEWSEPYRTYDEAVLSAYEKENLSEVLFWQFTQFVFLRQWERVKAYAHERGIRIMGDIPLYLSFDSVEMWKYGNALFQVDENRRPSFVAGVPPDAFSDDGQLWGNPLYDWEKMKNDSYAWWNARLKGSFALYDILRIDHFRGFDRYYAVPYGAENARNGHWEDGPKEALFADKLKWEIVAEDLGVIDDGVRRLMKLVGYPGMKILEFAFDGSPYNEHKPSNYSPNYICYTGTHDNMPLKQYIEDFSEWQKQTFLRDLKEECKIAGVRLVSSSVEALCQTVMRLACASVANTVILPVWDVLCKGGEARLNLPATVTNANWTYRFLSEEFTPSVAKRLKEWTKKYKRK